MVEKDSDRLSPTIPKKSKSRRNILVIGIVAFFILLAVVILASSQYFPTRSPAQAASLQTWQQWGMSIQYPSGLQAETVGISGQQVNSENGGVAWLWNNDATSLSLFWYTSSSYNVNERFQGLYDAEQNHWKNLTVINQGNITMAGATWEYQTSQCLHNGKTQYTTIAFGDYTSEQRVYGIMFWDSSPDTLSALEYYGNTFNG